MTFDLYAELDSQIVRSTDGSLPAGLVSGFVDECTSWFASKEIERVLAEMQEKEAKSPQEKKEARKRKDDAEKEKNMARQRYMVPPHSTVVEGWR